MIWSYDCSIRISRKTYLKIYFRDEDKDIFSYDISRLVRVTSPDCHCALRIIAWNSLSKKIWMIEFYFFENRIYVFRIFYMYKARSIVFHSWESMEVLDEMFTCFHHSFSLFPLPEKVSMFFHSFEYFSESWLISSWKKTPRISKACPPYHKPIEIFVSNSIFRKKGCLKIFRYLNFWYTIIITHNVTIAKYRDI